MSLRVALLFIGLIFIGIIAFTEMRRRRAHQNPRSIPERRDEPSIHVPKAYHPELEPESETDNPEQASKPSNNSNNTNDTNTKAGTGTGTEAGITPTKPDNKKAVFDINAHANDSNQDLDLSLDEQLDHVAYIKGGAPVAWTRLKKQALPVILDANESVQLMGQSTFGNTWYNVANHGEIGNFGNLAVRMPLLDEERKPAASDFNQLDVAAETIAELLGRRVNLPGGVKDPQSRAQELADFYRDYKFLLYVHIMAKSGDEFNGKDLNRVFMRQNLQFDNGFFHKPGAGGRKDVLFSVADLYEPGKLDNKKLKRHRTGGLTLFFSVPRVRHPSRVFIDMLKMADLLATGLEGQMYDPDFNEVSVDMLEATSEEIKQLEDAMQAFGIPAGSDTAKQLFSS